jgi:L-fuculose-phosphate aldolase
MTEIALQHLKVVTGRDLEASLQPGATSVRINAGAVLTPTAHDVIQREGLSVTRDAAGRTPAGSRGAAARGAAGGARGARGAEAAFRSSEAAALKAEIVNAAHKLWLRQYVDGNGGNITARLGDEWVLCTPTLMSKGDLQPDDLCLVDLQGNQVAGVRKRSSEVLLHLEIYKAVAAARAVLHCHPPHATAYAVTGQVPPTCMISEHEVFVGPVQLVRYETPGTAEFARTIVPYVKNHNTILLANHGLVTWADTVTHAEWYTEVMDTTCRILILASHLGHPPNQIPASKIGDLLAIKQGLGMPDARFDCQGCSRCDVPKGPVGITAAPSPEPQSCGVPPALDREALIKAVTDRVLEALKTKA